MLRRLTMLSVCAYVLAAVCCCQNPQTEVTVKNAGGKDYYRTLPPGAHALRKITDLRDIPDFTAAFQDRDRLGEAVSNSMHYLNKPSSKGFFPMSGISHRQVAHSLTAFKKLLATGKSPSEMNADLRKCFDVYTSVGCDDQGTVLFTGYYTPIFSASKTRSERFAWPLHRLPENHVKDPVTGETKGRKRADGSVDPNYPDRATLLASGELEGKELVWMENPFEAYVAGVQGSAILELADGGSMEVGYAGNNGHAYTSIGMELVKAGKLGRAQLNLRSMIAYFKQHPEDFEPMAAKNRRYVFFQTTSGGPFGCLNEQVLACRSIATDKSIFPRGGLCFVDTKLPRGNDSSPGTAQSPYRGFVLDQDAGGAIRAPGRCDVFMGVGDDAGELAGHTWAEGRLYYLILKDEFVESVGR